MSRTTAFKRFGQLTLAVLMMVLATAQPARSDTEMASQCFYLNPYPYAIRVVRIASDHTPGMQAIFVRFRYGGIFQMLGTGIRANSLTPPQKEMVVSFMDNEGNTYRWTALFDPATGSGPWTFYDDSESFSGTLVKVTCDDLDPAFAEAGEPGVGSPGPAR